jgi:hypothetical protein
MLHTHTHTQDMLIYSGVVSARADIIILIIYIINSYYIIGG